MKYRIKSCVVLVSPGGRTAWISLRSSIYGVSLWRSTWLVDADLQYYTQC